MSKVFQSLRRVSNLSRCPQCSRNSIRALSTRDLSRFQEGDRFVSDGVKLSKPLSQDGKHGIGTGFIPHKDIIGRDASTPFFARTDQGKLYRIEQPTLEQYISLTPRVVTPIYSSYCETIISLLDIHATPFYETDDPKTATSPTLEILDSGTGHGALTLHIAKAIASANPPPLNLQIPTRSQTSGAQTIDPAEHEEGHQMAQAWAAWKQTRRAVVHSVEDIPATGRHAEKVVQGFRQGLYWPHVDFHRAEVGQWVESQLAGRGGEPFLNYVFLDLPNVQQRLQECFTAMRDGAKVLIFVPSITQVCECVKMIKTSQMRMTVENVVELGEGISNGRKWDVRAVTPRRLSTPKQQQPVAAEAGAVDPSPDSTTASQAGDVDILPSESTEVEAATNGNTTSTDSEAEMSETPDSSSGSESANSKPSSSPNGPKADQETVMICRPKIGETIVGGGFVAVFRKMSLEEWELQYKWRKTRTGAQKKQYRS